MTKRVPVAARLAIGLASVLDRRTRADGWQPPVILASVRNGQEIDAINAAPGHCEAKRGAPDRHARFRAKAQDALSVDRSDPARAFALLRGRMALP